MAKIKNIEELRDFGLDILEKLTNGEIDTAQAGVSGKLCEGVISTLKTQMEYSRMLGEEPSIPFMRETKTVKVLESDQAKNKSLPSPPRRGL